MSQQLIKRFQEAKEQLLEFLYELYQQEARLWGTTIETLATGEERVLEDTNHLLYLYAHGNHDTLESMLEQKELKDFLTDLKALKKDFQQLKKQVKERNELKNLISSYSIKLVDERNYLKLQKIFLLEKQLHLVLERQDEELSTLLKDTKALNISTEHEKKEHFLGSLKRLRSILAGHLDHHELWEEERQGYSNTSNIITALIREIREDV